MRKSRENAILSPSPLVDLRYDFLLSSLCAVISGWCGTNFAHFVDPLNSCVTKKWPFRVNAITGYVLTHRPNTDDTC